MPVVVCSLGDESISHLLPTLKRCGAVAGKKGALQFQVPSKDKPISSEEVVTHVLKHLRGTAQAQVGGEVKRVVLAVPSEYTEAQQESLRHSAGDAGLTIARFITEPAAAVLAYDIGQDDPSKDHNVAVVHVGGTEVSDVLLLFWSSRPSPFTNLGRMAEWRQPPRSYNRSRLPLTRRPLCPSRGSFLPYSPGQTCVSVLAVRDGTIREVCAELERDLSGATFDEAICNVLKRDFKRKAKIDISEMARPLRKLAAAAESAKAVLSTKPTAAVSIDGLAEGMDLNVSVARSRFDAMNSKHYARAAELVTKVVGASGFSPDQITDVVLSGGAANIVGLKDAVQAVFGRPILLNEIPGEEVIAIGAGKQAALLVDPKNDKMNAKVTEVEALASDVCLKAADGSLVVSLAGSRA